MVSVIILLSALHGPCRIRKSIFLVHTKKMLSAQGKTAMAKRLIPGVQFFTSDVGVSSAKVSALLMGGQYPISIGSCISVDHRHNSKVYDFNTATGQIFSQYTDLVAKLQNLLSINLHYSVNAMMRICKKLCLPKKSGTRSYCYV